MTKQRYFHELNLLRGITIIAVILIHVSAMFTKMEKINTTTIINLMTDACFQFAVPMFIFISAFVLAAKYKTDIINSNLSLPQFYRKRFKKVLPSYFIFSLIYYFASILPDILDGSFKLNFIDFIGKILLARCHGNLWFIALILQFYIIFPVLYKLFFHARRKNLLTTVSFIIQIVWLIIIHHINKNSSIPRILKFTLFDIRFFLSHLGFFTFGFWVEKNRDKLYSFYKNKFPIVALLFTYSITLYYWISGLLKYSKWHLIPAGYMDISIITNQLQFIFIIALLYSFSISLSQRNSGIFKKMLVKAGERSFSIYLIHGLYLMVYTYLMKCINLSSSSFIYYFLLFCLTFLTSFVTAPLHNKLMSYNA